MKVQLVHLYVLALFVATLLHGARADDDDETCEDDCKECLDTITCGASPANCTWVVDRCEEKADDGDDDDDDDDDDDEGGMLCEEDCAGCLTNTTCWDSDETCVWESEACREMSDAEKYEYAVQVCQQSPCDKNWCAFNKKKDICKPKMEQPEVCELDCEHCSELECGSQDGCFFDPEEGECVSCDENCMACSTSATCDASGERCAWENDACREMTETEKYEYSLTVCTPSSCDFAWCNYNKKKRTCSPKMDRPETCDMDCEHCADENECNAQDGCSYDAEEGECVSCKDFCGACSSDETCGESKEGCVWETDACREMTETEKYEYSLTVCTPSSCDFAWCNYNKKKRTCSPKMDRPETCDMDCEHCANENECNAQDGCSYDAEEGECVSCKDFCGACSSDETCGESKEGCVWETDACREMTETEKYEYSLTVCTPSSCDFAWCNYNKKKRTCSPKMDRPETCDMDCEHCADENECNAQDGCSYDADEAECQSCSENCLACASENDCGASREGCVWDNDACRAMTAYEEFLRDKTVCQSAGGNKKSCKKAGGICRFVKGSGCSVDSVEPDHCNNDCSLCESEQDCTASEEGCSWSGSVCSEANRLLRF